MTSEKLVIKGAREHNLKNIDVELPRDKLIVITGLSGSGKSSLAFDTIYAEGQRRYVESLSAYARQFLGLMEKPDVDYIEGLSPAISIEQKSASKNPRSTVGTITEVYDYLRLLFARIGVPYCYKCGNRIAKQTVSQIVDSILSQPKKKKIQILSPLVRGRKGEYREVFEEVRKKGFIRARVDGKVVELDKLPKLNKKQKHTIEVVVDRLTAEQKYAKRLADSVETALKLSHGIVVVDVVGDGEYLFSESFACVKCGISYEELEPRMFSFNSPYGACKPCGGLGTRMEIDPDLIVADAGFSILEGVIKPWGEPRGHTRNSILPTLSEHLGFDLNTPWGKLSKKVTRTLLYGAGEEEFRFKYQSQSFSGEYSHRWEGIINSLERRYRDTTSDAVRNQIEQYMAIKPCHFCKGKRLRPESQAVKVSQKSIGDVTEMSVSTASEFFTNLSLTERELSIAGQILKEIKERLRFMVNVGLEYLTLERSAETLSGGEAQRIRLATQIGSSLVGVLYILDEPSIGLHQRDNKRLLATLMRLRDLGNTVIVVEHDRETILSADHVLDLGPRAGRHGGEIVAQGTPEHIERVEKSLTGQYLRGVKEIHVPRKRRVYNGKMLTLYGAKENNLKDIDVSFPLGLFICVTGVSGSGKSTLVNDILYRALATHFYRTRSTTNNYKRIDGLKEIDKVIDIDQSPIGRTPRSNPATYTGLFTLIRDLYANLPESKMRGYKQGRFSFNVKGGRCEACSGDGLIKIEMHFLPDVYVPCEICHGKRYNRETLEVTYKGKSIADVLDMTVDEALEYFENIPRVKAKLKTLSDVGLGYIHLGQSATTLSGGEAQRVKLSAELSKRSTGKTFYMLDEPTTGLHFEDVKMLLKVLHRLVDMGNTVVVIEHNLDVVKTADHIIDLGPEGGDEGGTVVTVGTPEQVIKVKKSYTGNYLKKLLNQKS